MIYTRRGLVESPRRFSTIRAFSCPPQWLIVHNKGCRADHARAPSDRSTRLAGIIYLARTVSCFEV